jgi:peptidoglycan hydrolase-like protein with peptidoglycan-binding domain
MASKTLQMFFLIPSVIAIAALPVCAQTRTDRAQADKNDPFQSPGGGDAAVTGQSPSGRMTGEAPAGRTQTGPVTPQSSAGMAASSEEIQKLQQALKDRGQDPGTVNGVMTPQTQQALKNFQAQQGLNATGTLDSQSRTALGLGPSTGKAPATGGTGAGNSTGTGLGTPIDPTLTPGQEAVPGSTSRGTAPSLPSIEPGTRAPSSGSATGSGGTGSAGGAGGMGGAGGAGGAGGGK